MKSLNADAAAFQSLTTPSLACSFCCTAVFAAIAQLVVFIALCVPFAATADSSAAKLLVSATVLKHASLKVLSQPATVVVTAADLAKGYVDAIAPASVQVRCNTQNGYFLMFESQGEFIRQTVVKGLTNDAQISAAGGGIAQNSAGKGMRQAQLELGFRFFLADSAQQGVYPWPIRLSVTPL